MCCRVRNDMINQINPFLPWYLPGAVSRRAARVGITRAPHCPVRSAGPWSLQIAPRGIKVELEDDDNHSYPVHDRARLASLPTYGEVGVGPPEAELIIVLFFLHCSNRPNGVKMSNLRATTTTTTPCMIEHGLPPFRHTGR